MRAIGEVMNTTNHVIHVHPSCTDFARLLPGQPKFIAVASPAIAGFEKWSGYGNDQKSAADALCAKLHKAGVRNNLTDGSSRTVIPMPVILS